MEETTTTGERAMGAETTKKNERAVALETTNALERAIRLETTTRQERAMRPETTTPIERATSPETTTHRERAIYRETTTNRERASGWETTKAQERTKTAPKGAQQKGSEMKRMEQELSMLQVDPRLVDLRPVNDYVVSKYRQAMRTGAEFPALKVALDGRVICGNHRYAAMMKEFGKEHKTKTEIHDLPDYAAELVLFASDNSAHGMPLDGFSRRRVAVEMAKNGKTPEEIARIFNVPTVAVEKWGGQTIIVRPCGKGRKKYMPVKRGVPEGKEITAAEYEAHKNKDYAIPARHIARQLIRWMESGLIDTENEAEVLALGELRAALVTNGY